MLKLTITVFLFTVFSGLVLANDQGQLKNSDTDHPDIQSQFEDNKNSETKEFKKFKYVDLQTGKEVDGETIIMIPDKDGKFVIPMKASEYFTSLNELEGNMAKNGLTLRDSGERVELRKAKMDDKLIQAQIKSISSDLMAKDDQIMKDINDPEKIADSIVKRAEDKSNAILKRLYAESSDDPNRQIKIKPFDPKVINKATEGLKTIVTKSWGAKKGKSENFAIDASASIFLNGSLQGVEAKATAISNVDVFSKTYNIMNAVALAGMYYADKVFNHEVSARLQVLGINLYDDAWKSTRAGTPETIAKTRKNSGESPVKKDQTDKKDATAKQVIKQGTEYYFMLGFIPTVVKVGVAGELDYGWVGGTGEFDASGGLQTTARLGGYAEVAVSYVVVEAGVGGMINIIDNQLKLEGFVRQELDKISGEPQIVAGVRGVNSLVLLSGELYAYVLYVVPAVGIPPYEKKSMETVLARFDGHVFPDQVLFNFEKVVRRGGFSLRGAPKPADYEEADIDSALSGKIAAVSNLVSTGSYLAMTKIAATQLDADGKISGALSNTETLFSGDDL